MLDISGQWSLALGFPTNTAGTVMLPGILQAQGYGEPVSHGTSWESGLHDACWYLRDEYAYAQDEEVKVPFLAQPARYYRGEAFYRRQVHIPQDGAYTLRIELTRWKTTAYIDGEEKASDFSLCTAHVLPLGWLSQGYHELIVCVDNRHLLPYRPDGHGVSDALGATWNGMCGEISLLTQEEIEAQLEERTTYARLNPRHIQVKDGLFLVDGKPEFLRGTHFGGEYPLTGMPDVSAAYWDKIMTTVRAWGVNFIRCHSYCPPEAAFASADRHGVYLQVEAGMWNVFNEDIPMLDILRDETRRILQEFGHHPSFILFSPTNEPSGHWYTPLKQWVKETRAYDEVLGYHGRRVYTAQSGWFYDVPPGDITADDTDYIYFHRSAYGPILGGSIRNKDGWKGRDYRSSLVGTTLPVVSHELGQWCSYPDFSTIDKFTGHLKPGSYEVYRENARAHRMLDINKQLAFHSGKNQVLMYKEDLEATFRTPYIYGFELLDLHDYLGQGTATVGVLDAFWDEKGYVSCDEWKKFCAPTVLLARMTSYVAATTDTLSIPLEVCHFGEAPLESAWVEWTCSSFSSQEDGTGRQVFLSGRLGPTHIPFGKNITLGTIEFDCSSLPGTGHYLLTARMGDSTNDWPLYLYTPVSGYPLTESDDNLGKSLDDIIYTKEWTHARKALEAGRKVLFTPYMDGLSYDCPPASLRPVFWNAQMGPTWQRGMGMVVDTAHPVFKDFPTEAWGGWQWEDILLRARGFNFDDVDTLSPTVRLIDDHNRNYHLALMLEARVGKGRLMIVSADLEEDFSVRPAAASLKHALMKYMQGEAFNPQQDLQFKDVERNLLPNKTMDYLGARVQSYTAGTVERLDSLLDGNPNTSCILKGDSYPLSVVLSLAKPEPVTGFVVLQAQKDRMHAGDVCTLSCEGRCRGGDWHDLGTYKLRSTIRQQRILFAEEIIVDEIRVTFTSGFLPEEQVLWQEEYDGWYKRSLRTGAVVELSIFNLLTSGSVPCYDTCYWNESPARTTTREIEA